MASTSVRGVCGCLSRHRLTSRVVCLCTRTVTARRHFGNTAIKAVVSETPIGYHAKKPPAVPLRKQLKDEAKQLKASGSSKKPNRGQTVPGWELTVGIEIHAQLNTEKKLFSRAVTSFNDTPNSHVAYFDFSLPGSQPVFQPETLIPAIRAALAMNCQI